MPFCHCTGGKHSQLPPLLWNRSRSVGKVCSSVRLILSCKTEEDDWSDQLHEFSHGKESCHSCRKCHKAVTELFTCCPRWMAVIHGMWASRLGQGHSQSAALRSSCGTGSRRDSEFRGRQTSHFCPIVRMIVWPKEGTEQVV